MSLQVPSAVLDRAQTDTMQPSDFLDCVRDSLPYAWTVVSDLAQRMTTEGGMYVEDNRVPPTDAERGQLLRALASSSMRSALEAHFGVALEFQNCCKVGAFAPEAVGGAAHADFVSPRAQLLNQAPELVDC